MNSTRWRRAQQAEVEHTAHANGFKPYSHAEAYFEDYWDTSIGVLTDASVLAVGSGTGIIHTFDSPKRAVALDPLNNKIRDQLNGSVADIVTGAGEALPLQSGRFDAVISFNVLDHCMDVEATLREMRRVLSPSGTFYLAVNTFALPGILRKILDHVDAPHPYHFHPTDIRQLLEDAGFSVTHFQSDFRYSDRSRLSFVNERDIKQFIASYSRICWTTAVTTPA